jgi:rubrerythrin
MNIYNFAKQMEQDGEIFYREMASQAAAPGVQRILNMLADDEAKHYETVRQLEKQATVPEMAPTEVLANANNVFAQMQGQSLELEELQVEIYQQAQELERKSRDFYRERAGESQDAAHKALFLRLADEEQRHYFLLEHMIEFVDRPRSWIEDAEFNHLQEY